MPWSRFDKPAKLTWFPTTGGVDPRSPHEEKEYETLRQAILAVKVLPAETRRNAIIHCDGEMYGIDRIEQLEREMNQR